VAAAVVVVEREKFDLLSHIKSCYSYERLGTFTLSALTNTTYEVQSMVRFPTYHSQ
jgi:hypothetical protein